MRGFSYSFRTWLAQAIAFVCITFGAVFSAQAICCGHCGDSCFCNSRSDFCCGKGKCNIFCCNCDDGCVDVSDAQKCELNCLSRLSLCSNGCNIACSGSPTETCEIFCSAKCEREHDACKSGCGKDCISDAPAGDVRAKQLWDKYDKNSDGYLTSDEFEIMLKEKSGGRFDMSHFQDMDADKDGRLSLSEVGISVPTDSVREGKQKGK